MAEQLFESVFSPLTGHACPFAWQQRLFERLQSGEIPAALDLPTGLGKTSVMALWLIALALQLREGRQPLLPRRLVYVVDRRAVVDQATAEATRIAEALKTTPELAWMRAALGLGEGEELPISTLRGQKADNRAWLADPAKPAIIVGTVDMTGSRLLFSSYGVSRGMRPVHAAMLGVDSLFVLDESHLVPPFQKLLEQIASADARIWPEREIIHPLQVLPLSATGESKAQAFTLTAEDEADEMVRQRLRAAKQLELRALPENDGKDALVQPLAEAAWALAFEKQEEANEGGAPPQPRMAARNPARAARVLVYADSREVAQKVAAELDKRAAPGRGKKREEGRIAHVELFTGARRVFEREQAQQRLADLGFLAGTREGEEYRDKPAFLIATSAAEVGIDMDADHMVGDVVELERMIQRFGRVNRLGDLRGDNASRIIVLVAKATDGKKKDKKKDKAQERQERLKAVVRALEKLDGDASPVALRQLREADPALVAAASTPPPLYPPLEPPTVEAWAMTSLKEHTARPDIAPWLRGWVEEEPQATIIWRQHLPWRENAPQPVKSEVEAFFRAAPPHLLEMLEAPASLIADVLVRGAKRWKKALEKEAAGKGENFEAEKQPAFLALTPAGDFSNAWSLAALAGEKASRLMPRIAGRLLVAARELGGLDDNGLLNKGAETLPSTPDAEGEERWEQEWIDGIGYRVRLVHQGEDENGTSSNWRPKHMLVLQRDAEGEPTEWLMVEALQRPDGQESEGPVARCDYGLSPHLNDVAEEAHKLAERLGLPQKWREILQLAGRWHDAGKNRLLWQQAAGNRRLALATHEQRKLDATQALAKTKGPFRSRLLGGYRHEFGSLHDMSESDALANLPQEQRDIVMHLVAAHHGHARPLIAAIDPLQMPSTLQQRAAEVALRFARLQRRFGPWGLAWLEALLRAADRKASAEIGTVHPCMKEAGERREGTHG